MAYYEPENNEELHKMYIEYFVNKSRPQERDNFQAFVAGYIAAKKQLIEFAKKLEDKQ